MTIFDGETYDTILERMLARLPSDIDKREGSVVYDLLAPAALEFAQVYLEMDNVLDLGFAESTYGEYLDRKVAEQGLTRKPAIQSAGKLTFTGSEGLEIPTGTRVGTTDDIYFVTTETGVVSNGAVTVAAESEIGGADGNVGVGLITNIDAAELDGLSSVTNTEVFSGGVDEETDEQLFARYQDLVTRPITSGNKYQYEAWAKEIQGVANATCYPLWNGPGTVKVVVVDSENRSPAQAVIDAVAAYIEEQRPIGSIVTVAGVTEVPIDVSAAITTDGSTDVAAITSSIIENVSTYLKTFTTGGEIVRYSQIANAVLDSSNIIDYSDLRVNGAVTNISIASDEVPVMGAVSITIN